MACNWNTTKTKGPLIITLMNTMKFNTFLLVFLLCSCSLYAQVNPEKWKIFELTLSGPSTGNPFIDVKLSGKFINEKDTISVTGFYDGEDVYKIRFMPQKEGAWKYVTSSNIKKLADKKGSFVCTPALKNNHGPVAVKDTFYFAYADGTPHHSFGTTCYGWVHQGDSLAELTLKTSVSYTHLTLPTNR